MTKSLKIIQLFVLSSWTYELFVCLSHICSWMIKRPKLAQPMFTSCVVSSTSSSSSFFLQFKAPRKFAGLLKAIYPSGQTMSLQRGRMHAGLKILFTNRLHCERSECKMLDTCFWASQLKVIAFRSDNMWMVQNSCSHYISFILFKLAKG